VDWGDVPTWLAAVGTIAAVTVALWQASSDRRSKLATLREDVAARGDRADAERRSQAELISGWYAGDRAQQLPGGEHEVSVLRLMNGSDQPIYEVVVILVLNNRGGEGVNAMYRQVFLDVPPGTFALTVPSGWHGMSAAPGVEVSFTDRTGGAHWIRRANGVLEEIAESAIEHYEVGRPFGYEIATPL
jgi:hypothetical protein